MTREGRQYWLIRAAVIGGFILIATASWTIATRQYLALYDRTTGCGCAAAPLQWTAGTAIGSIAVALVTLYLTARIAIEVSIRVRRHRRFMRRLQERGRFVWNHVLQKPVLIVTDSEAQAMTIGLLQPRIMVTTGLVRQLNFTEVGSVLRHEQAHARAFDPLWSLLLESIGATLGWIGGLRHIINSAFSLREIIADAAATANYTQAHGLSGAMYKLATASQPSLVPAFSPNADRVTKLLDASWVVPVRGWSWRTALLGLSILAGLWIVNGLPAATAAAQPMTEPTAACWLQEIMCAQPPTRVILMSPDALMSKYGW